MTTHISKNRLSEQKIKNKQTNPKLNKLEEKYQNINIKKVCKENNVKEQPMQILIHSYIMTKLILR